MPCGTVWTVLAVSMLQAFCIAGRRAMRHGGIVSAVPELPQAFVYQGTLGIAMMACASVPAVRKIQEVWREHPGPVLFACQRLPKALLGSRTPGMLSRLVQFQL